jgi:hypothetical protein
MGVQSIFGLFFTTKLKRNNLRHELKKYMLKRDLISDRQNITEILLKVTLNTITLSLLYFGAWFQQSNYVINLVTDVSFFSRSRVEKIYVKTRFNIPLIKRQA